MEKKQFLVVEAETQEQAHSRVLQKMMVADDHPQKWFKQYTFSEADATRDLDGQEGQALLDYYHRVRFDSFSEINEGLDINQVSAGIWVYGDDSKGDIGLQAGSEVEQRFKANAEKMIKVIEFVDNRWTPNSVIFDLEDLTADLSGVYERIGQSRKQFLVPLVFTY